MELDWLSVLESAAKDRKPVRSLTHSYYRYPARFSAEFAAAAIRLFSRPGDIVLDPFMGGGTTVLEAYALGRRAYGVDLNQLSVFITRAKLTTLDEAEIPALSGWLDRVVAGFNYSSTTLSGKTPSSKQVRNLSGPEARPIKKLLRFTIAQLHDLPTLRSRRFARCILLRTSQWALDGRRYPPSISEFKSQLLTFAEEMLCSMIQLREFLSAQTIRVPRPRLVCGRAESLPQLSLFRNGRKAALVVTSPPYPGVHVLYHRWQVLGRRETPAPYWISGCQDGQGASFYNFGDRHDPSQKQYFESYAASLAGISNVLEPGGVLVQMVACRNPHIHLPQIVLAVERAGFEPVGVHDCLAPITRTVPGRKWHALLQGNIETSNEFVLIHRRV